MNSVRLGSTFAQMIAFSALWNYWANNKYIHFFNLTLIYQGEENRFMVKSWVATSHIFFLFEWCKIMNLWIFIIRFISVTKIKNGKSKLQSTQKTFYCNIYKKKSFIHFFFFFFFFFKGNFSFFSPSSWFAWIWWFFPTWIPRSDSKYMKAYHKLINIVL